MTYFETVNCIDAHQRSSGLKLFNDQTYLQLYRQQTQVLESSRFGKVEISFAICTVTMS